MKKALLTLGIVVTFFACTAAAAGARAPETVRVGLRYGSSALPSANLENAQGAGYAFGRFTSDGYFLPETETGETTITMIPLPGGGIQVTVTGTGRILYETWDNTLDVQPLGADPITWFKGYRYRGGFSYTNTGSAIEVVNVVDLEDYVKGVVPHEMSGAWPLEALKAQAVCARTYAARTAGTRHSGFDLCATTHCQVYNGASTSTATSDRAVDETAGECLYHNGALIEAVYHSSDGGATESAVNVWGAEVPYLQGKADPYERQTSIPNYNYTVDYTWDQLTWVLQNSGYSIGDVVDAAITRRTPQGNVAEVQFTDSRGKTLTVTGDSCRMCFYSTTYNKNVQSLRFDIAGGSGTGAAGTVPALDGASVLTGTGALTTLTGDTHTAITSTGQITLTGGSAGGGGGTPSGSGLTITGAGNGHNVGMSQYGAKAMAESGHTYEDILYFYYTGVDLR